MPHNAVKRYIGVGSLIYAIKKLNAENKRAKKLQIPIAVDANKIGKK